MEACIDSKTLLGIISEEVKPTENLLRIEVYTLKELYEKGRFKIGMDAWGKQCSRPTDEATREHQFRAMKVDDRRSGWLKPRWVVPDYKMKTMECRDGSKTVCLQSSGDENQETKEGKQFEQLRNHKLTTTSHYTPSIRGHVIDSN